jgi:hypothetical protein
MLKNMVRWVKEANTASKVNECTSEQEYVFFNTVTNHRPTQIQ